MTTHDDYCLQEYKYLYDRGILNGSVAFITGGGSGIGFRIAELFMRHGCDTAIASRNIQKLEESAGRLAEATSRQCLPVQMDPQTVKKAVAATLEKFGRIDILVNSAAGNFVCPASSLSPNAFKTVIEIDTIGTFNVTKAVFDAYFRNHGGVILNISATLHYIGTPFQAHAGSAKAAIDALTRHLAVEWGDLNIRINGIAPGPIEGTEGMRKLGGGMEDAFASHIPLHRLGTKTDVAEAAIFLTSPLSSYITGATLVVDGGSWMVEGGGSRSALLSKL
ncbi:hypothetical protein EMCRGX_G028310 [Ephydatia muelleri]